MTTYSIATFDNGPLLLCTVPDGADREAALQAVMDDSTGEFDAKAVRWTGGLTLTDDEPAARPEWDSQWGFGFLFDADGGEWRYAVRSAVDGRPGAMFEVDGNRCTLAELLEANDSDDDDDLREWARSAKAGDVYPSIAGCECVA